MRDPFGSFQYMMSQFKGFMGNPMQMLSGKMNIPQNMNNPRDIIQHLMDSGQLTQQQYNMANNFCRQAQNNPQFNQFMNR